jgi:hypothetical protein
MPTIEIASLNSSGLNLNDSDYKFAIIEEKELKSHRGLFYDTLNNDKGVIIHIGNPTFKEEKHSGFFAGEIIDWTYESEEDSTPGYQTRFKFLNEYKNDIEKLLRIALHDSPIKKAFFLTDYQFGIAEAVIEDVNSLDSFWEIHNDKGLRFNTLYILLGS